MIRTRRERQVEETCFAQPVRAAEEWQAKEARSTDTLLCSGSEDLERSARDPRPPMAARRGAIELVVRRL